jgi:hypothetical protein
MIQCPNCGGNVGFGGATVEKCEDMIQGRGCSGMESESDIAYASTNCANCQEDENYEARNAGHNEEEDEEGEEGDE